MKRFFLKFLSFSIVTLIILLAYNQVHDSIIVDQRKLNQIISYFNEHSNEFSALVIGNSHPNWALSHKFLPDGTLNFTAAGLGFKEMYMMTRHALRKSDQIKLIILQLDYLNFYIPSRASYNVVDLRNIVDFDEYRTIYDIDITKALHHDFLFRMPIFNPYYNDAAFKEYFRLTYNKLLGRNKLQRRFYDASMDVVQSVHKQIDEYPADTLDKLVDDSFKEHQYENGVSEESLNNFTQLVEFCKNHDIKLIGVYYPMSKHYQDKIDSLDKSAVDNLVEQSGIDVILNYARLYDDHQYYFENPTHLNIPGRDAFSRYFGDELKAIPVVKTLPTSINR